MSKAAAKTGSEPAVLVAAEQFFPENERILNDSLSYRFLPANTKLFINIFKFKFFRNQIIKLSEKYGAGLWGGLLCRKRYIDEKLIQYSDNFDAVVNLGAGLDTRLYRLPALSGIPSWELDQKENISTKEKAVYKVFHSVPEHIKLAAIDFDRENIRDVLKNNGFSRKMTVFFIWEAVTQYLTKDGIEKTFDFLSEAKSGSLLTFTYVHRKFIDGLNMYNLEHVYKRFVKSNIWIFGMEPEEWSGYLKKYGWKVIEDMDYSMLAEKYIKPAKRKLLETQVERVIFAIKT